MFKVEMRGWARILGVIACLSGAGCAHDPPSRAAAADVARPEAPQPTAEAAAAPPTPTDSELEGVVPLWLPRFYAALNQLASEQRQEHVRVLWFGDSHTAADFWTDSVRRPLQDRFGAGGAGLVHLGLRMYRHGEAVLSRTGDWRTLPPSPAGTRARVDGMLGLGGLGAAPLAENASASLVVGADAAWARGVVRWELLYRLPRSTSGFRVQVGNGPPRPVSERDGEARASGLRSLVVSSSASPRLTLSEPRGGPELFGVFVETESPGVVVDTLGINGARAATPLSWDVESWTEEVRARRPALVVLAYGTNEVGDTGPLSVYEAQYAELLRRIRVAAPDVDCLLAGPTDRAGRDWLTEPRVIGIDDEQARIAERLGCAYFSVLDAMGGPGSLEQWAFQTPRLARRDRVHLLPAGYRKLGAMMAEQLLQSYAARYAEAER